MKRLIALVLLCAAAVPAVFAQTADTVVTSLPDEGLAPRVQSQVDSVDVVIEQDQPVLHVSGILPPCDQPVLFTTEQQGDVLFVDVYHDPTPLSVVACPTPGPMLLTVPAGEILGETTPNHPMPHYLVVNTLYYAINIAMPQTQSTATPTITLTRLTRSDVDVQTLSVQLESDGLISVTVQGTLVHSCPEPTLSRLMRAGENAYVIDVFQAVEEPMLCPMTYVAVAFEHTIKTPVTQATSAVFSSQAQQIRYMAQGPVNSVTDGPTVTILHTIESLEAEVVSSNPAQISLHIVGYQPDGCNAFVSTTQERQGSVVTVQISRELAADTMCPAVITPYEAVLKLDGTFDAGLYTIIVNGSSITVQI